MKSAGPTMADTTLLPVVALRNIVFMPSVTMPLLIGRERSRNAVARAGETDKIIGFVSQRHAEQDDPGAGDLYEVGTAGVILKGQTTAEGNLQATVQGRWRFRVVGFEQTDPYLLARVVKLPDRPTAQGFDIETVNSLRSLAQAFISASTPEPPHELLRLIERVPAPDPLCYILATGLPIPFNVKQEVLEERDPQRRAERLQAVLEREVRVLKMTEKIRQEGRREVTPQERERFLRRNLDAIKDELADMAGTNPDIAELKEKLRKARLPRKIQADADRELARIVRIPSSSPEYPVVENYLTWLASLPWRKRSREKLDIKEAERVLNENHYDILDVKERILEYLATRKLKPGSAGAILCLVGPPGVGKTSLGHSIAEATNRKLVRISLGGVNDEAEIRGHRRTYIGSMPGRIIRALRQAGVNNPLIVLDEVDKLTTSIRGDPTAALLEVLDPEQNSEFIDHYLDVPVDLSHVFFLATANTDYTIPFTLRDRMEMIYLPGYTPEEKFQIGRNYLAPRQIEATGLKPGDIEITDEALNLLIEQYSREAGVRSLERNLAGLCRKMARLIVEGGKPERVIRPSQIEQILGPPPFHKQAMLKTDQVGVAPILVLTETGAELATVETCFLDGGGNLSVTGRAGTVLKEAAQAALTHFKSIAEELGVDSEVFLKRDVHIHFTRPVLPLDTSASGLAIFLSLASRALDRPLGSRTCYCGEVTLRGRLLRVENLRERFICARRYGFDTVLLPHENEVDLADVPDDVKESLTIHLVATTREALALALPKPGRKRARART